MKGNAITAGIVLLSVLIGGGLLAVTYYQDAVYETDRAAYEHEKAVFDERQDSIVSFKRDSLYANWVETNDTTIRRIEEIKHKSRRVVTMLYVDSLQAEMKRLGGWVDCPGFDTAYCNKLRRAVWAERDRVDKQWYDLAAKLHKKKVKTGRYECSPADNGKMLCEDETRIVWLPENTTIYWDDTVWSSGNISRDQWVSKASKYADSLASQTRLEYGPYSGHEFHYILKVNSALYQVWSLIAIFTPITFLIGLGMLISRAIETRKERKKQ